MLTPGVKVTVSLSVLVQLKDRLWFTKKKENTFHAIKYCALIVPLSRSSLQCEGLTCVSYEPWGSDDTCSVGVTGRTLLLLSMGLWADFFDSVLLFPRMNPEGKPRNNILGSWITLQVQQAFWGNKSCDNWVRLPPQTAHAPQLRGSGEADSVDFRDPAQYEMPSHFQLPRVWVYIQIYFKNS